jgi:ABC-type spermidine/putrescine transport system permease subunit II
VSSGRARVEMPRTWVGRTVRLTFASLFAAFILGPFCVLLLWSIAQSWFWPSALPTAFTLRWYKWATVVPDVLHALRMSLVVATLATVLTTTVALPASLALSRRVIRLRGFLGIASRSPRDRRCRGPSGPSRRFDDEGHCPAGSRWAPI